MRGFNNLLHQDGKNTLVCIDATHMRLVLHNLNLIQDRFKTESYLRIFGSCNFLVKQRVKTDILLRRQEHKEQL